MCAARGDAADALFVLRESAQPQATAATTAPSQTDSKGGRTARPAAAAAAEARAASARRSMSRAGVRSAPTRADGPLLGTRPCRASPGLGVQGIWPVRAGV